MVESVLSETDSILINSSGIRPLFSLSKREVVKSEEYQIDLFRLAYYLDRINESYPDDVPIDWQHKGLLIHLEKRLKKLDNQSTQYFETVYICYAIGMEI